MQHGKVWLVGAGPGDPGLITVRGSELLGRADVVLYDALSHPALLALCPAHAELRNVGKRGGKESPDQSWITEQLISLARAGKRVVRLKGGDAFLFARGAEEAEALANAQVEFEVVPGLPSPVGTSAYAGIPLTHRELSSSVTFITGSDRRGEAWSDTAWKKLATATDTLCILMGMRHIERITRAIMAGGRDPGTPVAVIQWGARPEQRVLTSQLADVAEAVRKEGLSNPAVIVVGEVVRLRALLNWYERSPLFGKRVLVPRPELQARATATAIRERGAEPVVFPVIEICDPPEPELLSRAVASLGQYAWVLFTSANGVARCFAEMQRQSLDARAFGASKVGVIGPKTATALAERGITADLVAREYVGEGLARDLIAQDLNTLAKGVPSEKSPTRVLLLRALVARDELPKQLRAAGMQVDVVPAYQTRSIDGPRRDELRRAFEQGTIDVVLFTSSSTVHSTMEALGTDAQGLLRRAIVASIGPVTTQTARNLGLHVDVTATEYTVDGLLDAVADHLALLDNVHPA